MKAQTTTCWKYLEARPGFLRQLWIKDSSLTARDVYGMHVSAEEPWSIDAIAAEHNLPPAAVEEAITYCRANPKEIEQDRLREEALWAASGISDPNYQGKPRIMSPEEWRRIEALHS